MKDKKKTDIDGRPKVLLNPATASTMLPLATRLSIEIPKPKDWQAFQRNCVLLFRDELKDPNALEYGRGGQDQSGIDILGKRNGNPEHYVGVQCRLIAKPLKHTKILADCRAALDIEAGLKEIIFATTAPDDTGATNAATAVEGVLRNEGHDLTVVVYGWGALQTLIAVHEVAYTAFFPSIVATLAPQVFATGLLPDDEFASQIAAQLVKQLRQTGLSLPSHDTSGAGMADEAPALHARIDTYRDLFKDHQQPVLAQQGLLALLKNEVLDDKPWARFRIETNLGSIDIELGREEEGAARYETAFAIRPDDPNAIANLAFARTIQGRYDEAMDLAVRALNAEPRADHAVACLLQAAARSTWQGDPETLIPPDLIGSEHADLGLVEFLRRRNLPGWDERSLELSRRHPDHDIFKRIRAIAVLSRALDAGGLLFDARSAVTIEELNAATEDLKAFAEHCLDIEFADQHDLAAYLSNAGLLLRLAGRHAECEALLHRGLPMVTNEPQLRRLLALAQAALGRREEAISTLADDHDSENQLLGAELAALDDPRISLARVQAVDPTILDPRLAKIRWGLVGELALKIGETEIFKSAVAALRELNSADTTADLLELRGDIKAGLTADAIHKRLHAMAIAFPLDGDMVTRFFLAEELRHQGLPGDASTLLERHVDLSRKSPLTTLYLQSLAEARRDEAFLHAITSVAPIVREDPEILWTTAAHAWNAGDLVAAYSSIEELLIHEPDNARARLLKIEILVRQDNSTEVFAELEKRVEDLTWTSLQDNFRLAALLGHFGYIERAVTLAYRLFLGHRDKSQAWMTLSMLVLKEGRGVEGETRLWNMPAVAGNAAVDLRYDDGDTLFLVVEPDADLRALDSESWEPDHPLVQTLMGLAKNGRFIDPAGREGSVIELRHKYVARLHYVMRRYESRFPEIFGFQMVSIHAEQPGGLDEIISELKARREWVESEEEQYQNGPWPLGILAHRLGLDTIEVSGGLATQGIPLKVAIGNEPEREAARRAVENNDHKGCVLDLLAFWTSWQLQALDVIVATCGPVHLAQSVMDRLRARREMIDFSRSEGIRSAHYEDGKLALQEIPPETVKEWSNNVGSAIAWAEANATICPLIVGEDLPSELRELLRAGRFDIFDSLVVAKQAGALLITDDLPTRELNRLVAGAEGAWLHQVFSVALNQKCIEFDTFIRWSAHLINAGHNYIGVTGEALSRALKLDAEAGGAPGYLFKTLSKVIGGRSAEPKSHIIQCLKCLRDLWSDTDAQIYHRQATGLLLHQLVRERHDDYGLILQVLLHQVRSFPRLVEYIRGWAQGHFIPESALCDANLAGKR